MTEIDRYRKALEFIAAPKYGVQSIQEEYGIDSEECRDALLKYYSDMTYSFQRIARKTLQDD